RTHGPPRPGPHQSGAPAGRRDLPVPILSAPPLGGLERCGSTAIPRRLCVNGLPPERQRKRLPPNGGGDGIILRSGSTRRPWTRVASVRTERASRPHPGASQLERTDPMKTTTKNQPTHRAYAVTKRAGKSYWREIGAAWAHGDGEGFGLVLDYLPLNGAEIVIRKPLPKDEQQVEEGGAQ